jgi:hypothetical protein
MTAPCPRLERGRRELVMLLPPLPHHREIVMLYNPDWQKAKTCDPMKLATLIAWLERCDPFERYDYKNCRHCMLAQYFSACGFDRVEVSRTHVVHDTPRFAGLFFLGNHEELPEHFDWIASHGSPTFGAALRRAKLVNA